MTGTPAAVLLPGWFDPEVLWEGGPARHPHAFWLDAGPDAVAGWSWLGVGQPESDPDAVTAVECARDGAGDGDPESGPFRGGWVGWLGYEDAAARVGAPVAAVDPALDGPQRLWLRAERFLAVDHARRRIWAVATDGDAEGLAAAAMRWAGDGDRRGRAEATASVPTAAAPLAQASARHTPEQYAALVERCRDAIREGDAYQLCLTTRFDVAAVVDPTAVYRRLRTAHPTHHGGFIRAGDAALASASPERFLEVSRGTVRTRPIKGTRPRGEDPADDERLAAELAASPKEQAENVMIVDLMRNDLSRVGIPGSIAVDDLLRVESYPAVHQLVSTVSASLAPGTTVGDLLDAAFPAGSMTGAPKLSAMTILHRLEHAPRGVFAGCFGWIGTDGSLDLAMVIRSIVTHPGGAYVGAGGGITWGSEAPAEVAEVGVKARGPLAALGAEPPPGW